jgi:hypothetical protein
MPPLLYEQDLVAARRDHEALPVGTPVLGRVEDSIRSPPAIALVKCAQGVVVCLTEQNPRRLLEPLEHAFEIELAPAVQLDLETSIWLLSDIAGASVHPPLRVVTELHLHAIDMELSAPQCFG